MTIETIDRIFDAAFYEISDVLPSDWAENNRFMTSEVSAMEGMFSFENSPYVKDIVNELHPSSPSKVIVIMKGAQLGLSTGFIENGIGWIISQNPGPILFLVGHDDLVEKAGQKVDNMIDSTGIRTLIKTNSKRKRNTKSGDTDRQKEFPGGNLTLGPTNHKTLRQVSYRYGFIDDFEAMKGKTKESGDTVNMIMQRFSTYKKNMKLCFISTPELRETSNIEPEYLKGDQRRYFIPCPCCGEFITLEWSVKSEINEDVAGMTWKLTENGTLIEDSIGYTCQKCGGFFDETNKTELLNKGVWKPTAEPLDSDYVSFHISALYAPTFMFGWTKYVKQYLEANPIGQPRIEEKHQAFVNLVLGETYELEGEQINANELKKNQRDYEIGTIPESISINDGNGKIILLTIGADMNGKLKDEKFHDEDDARLDWEIVAWSETGASYSIDHGSIGTFQHSAVRDDSYHADPRRIRWSYKRGSEYCVWDEFDKILNTEFKTDTGRSMGIYRGCLDSAPYTTYSYPYIENQPLIYGIKGDKDHGTGIHLDQDYQLFKLSKESNHLWILNVNRIKDVLSNYIGLIWDKNNTPIQPPNFMNFPKTNGYKYLDRNYFNHFESEHKIVDEKTRKLVWQKKSNATQNHMFDCRIYALAARYIFTHDFFKNIGAKQGTWTDLVKILKGE